MAAGAGLAIWPDFSDCTGEVQRPIAEVVLIPKKLPGDYAFPAWRASPFVAAA
jgi:hypothetical protein